MNNDDYKIVAYSPQKGKASPFLTDFEELRKGDIHKWRSIRRSINQKKHRCSHTTCKPLRNRIYEIKSHHIRVFYFFFMGEYLVLYRCCYKRKTSEQNRIITSAEQAQKHCTLDNLVQTEIEGE